MIQEIKAINEFGRKLKAIENIGASLRGPCLLVALRSVERQLDSLRRFDALLKRCALLKPIAFAPDVD